MKSFLFGGTTALLLTTAPWLISAPSLAQFANVKQHLQSLPSSRVVFKPGTTSTTIENSTDHIYILKAKARQTLNLKANSLGARASVTLYGVNGKPLSQVLAGGSGEGKAVRLRLPATGDYYIVGGAGSTNHVYNFTVSIK